MGLLVVADTSYLTEVRADGRTHIQEAVNSTANCAACRSVSCLQRGDETKCDRMIFLAQSEAQKSA